MNSGALVRECMSCADELRLDRSAFFKIFVGRSGMLPDGTKVTRHLGHDHVQCRSCRLSGVPLEKCSESRSA